MSDRCSILGCRRKADLKRTITYHRADSPLGEPQPLCRQHHEDVLAKCPPSDPGHFWTYGYGVTMSTGYTITFPGIEFRQ